MKMIEAGQVDQALTFPALIDALDHGFQQDFGMPQRQVFSLSEKPDQHDGFAVLPAWTEAVIGVKAFTYFPDNAKSGHPSLHSKILLFSRSHGLPLAMVDGTSVTYWRTAAISALASRYLSRTNAKTLLLLGTGKLAIPLIRAHLAVRQIRRVYLWGRTLEKVFVLRQTLETLFPDVEFFQALDLPDCAAQADIIVSATGSATPLLSGAWIRPGCHVDLLGNHTPDRRECDSELIMKSAVFVDSRANVLKEAGELLIPIAQGQFNAGDIRAELAQLCRKTVPGRVDDEQITLFKSVGTALSDVIAAHLVLLARTD